MRRFVLTALFLPFATPTFAQDCNVLCSPAFVAQPGVITNAINPREVSAGDNAESSMDFLFRVTTVIPTELPRTTLVGIVQWTPFAKVGDVTANAPAFVYGPVFTLFNAGPLTTTVDVLGLYSPAGEESDYKHRLLLSLDLNMSLGNDALPFLRNVSLYGFLAQQMSDRPTDVDGDRPYSPLLLFGVTLPLAPLP